MKKIIVTLTALLLCMNMAFAQASMIDDVVKRGTLRVGFSTFVPWAMQNKTGEFIGFEIDVAQKIADDFGVKLELVPTSWSGIIPALLQGKFDIIVGGMGITPERMISVNFTNPYDYSGIEGIASKKMAGDKFGVDAFNQEGVIIAVRSGSTPALVAKKMFPKAEYRLFDNEATAVQEVLSDRVHLFLSSAPLPSLELDKNKDKLYRAFDGLISKEPIGFAVKKGDFDSINALNGWITINELNGFLEEKREYWFRTSAWEKDIE